MPAERLDGGHVKGGMLHAHVLWLTQNRPDVPLEAVRRRLSGETAHILASQVLPTSWYPFRAVVELDRAIAAACGADERETAVELGRHSARVNLTTSYRVFKKDRPQDFFQDQARLHARFQDFGTARFERLGENGCRLRMLDYPCYSKVFCWSGVGFYEEASALHGAVRPSVVEAECVCEGGSACLFEIRWEGLTIRPA
jgi:hypothetical protein